MSSVLIDNNYNPKKSLLLFFGLLFFVNLFLIGNRLTLWDDDEAAYAGFALRMLETGDWVNPDFTWSDVHRKTPFHFWTIALSYLIFGVNEFAVRVPSNLAVLLTCLLLYFYSPKIFGKAVSSWAAIIFSTSFLGISMGKMSLTDAWLMFFETLALISLFRYMEKPSIIWNLMLWLAVSVGILVKGPPIIILVGGVWLGLALMHPERKRLIGTHPWIFGPLSLLPFVLWAYLSYLKDGGKLLTFLYEWYVVERIGGSVFGQSGPPGYHFAVAAVAFLPWLPLFLAGFWQTLRYPKKSTANIYLFLWLLFGWGFYELMSSKLPSYAMGAHPAFAIMSASVLVSLLKKENQHAFLLKWGWYISALLWILFAIAISLLFRQFFLEDSGNIPIVSGLMIVLAVPVFFLSFERKILFAGIWGGAVLALLWGPVGNAFDRTAARSSRKIVLEMEAETKKYADPDSTIAVICGFSNRQLRMSFPFYLEQHFGTVKEYTKEEFFEAINNGEKMIVIFGEELLPLLDKADAESWFRKPYAYKALSEWRSLNDQLKIHNFKCWHNLEQK